MAFSRHNRLIDKELAEFFWIYKKKAAIDMLVKTYLKTCIQKYILVHIEIQDGWIKALNKASK